MSNYEPDVSRNGQLIMFILKQPLVSRSDGFCGDQKITRLDMTTTGIKHLFVVFATENSQ